MKKRKLLKKTILIDLDGVLNNYKGNYEPNFIPEPARNADKFLNEISKNYNITIFTSRNILLTSKWLIKNSLDKYISDVTNVKKPCFLYIDDRVVCHKGNFEETLKEIDKFNVHWKKSNHV